MRLTRRRLVAALTSFAVMLGLVPAVIATAGTYTAPLYVFGRPTQSSPEMFRWQGIQLNSPSSDSGIATPTSACTVASGQCEDTTVVVPAPASASSPQTMYVKVQWQHPVWRAYLFVIDPTGKVVGGGASGCDRTQLDKGCGNETTLPFDELTIPNPVAGAWKIRVAAVNIHNEAYTGMAALTARPSIEYAKKNLDDLTKFLTRDQRVNVAFVGWNPTPDELVQLQGSLTGEFQPAVAHRQSCDGSDQNDVGANQVSGLVQHVTCHYTGTDPNNPNNTGLFTPAVPYFEPLKFNFDYHYLVADETYTRAMFGAMSRATTNSVPYSSSRIPQTPETAPFKTGYLTEYNATSGQFRNAALQVTDTRTVDMIDGPAVEDWVFNTRLSNQFANSFTDLNPSDGTVNTVTGAQFINPDPNAAENPFWLNDPTKANSGVNVDRNPQGLNQGITFFLVDTYSPTFASEYFHPNAYHSWWTNGSVTDPDTGQPLFADNARGWGGKYRFHILDLGAAPSTYERSNWLTATVNDNDGSAGFDPPIWQYRNDPRWNGSQQPLPTQVAGNTIGQVMGYEITQGIAFKYVGGYLYRPIPNDVYVIANNQWVDYYSTPAGGGLYKVDMDKVDNPVYSLGQLRSAAPYSTFLPGPSSTVTLGCSSFRYTSSGTAAGAVATVPDPNCTKPDPAQEAVERAKNTGSGGLLSSSAGAVPDAAVNQNVLRDYIDANRSRYAPLYDGAFTVPVLNIMFEKKYNVALPLIVGGIAASANGGDGWGQIDNVNEDLVPSKAIDCSRSATGAPGCNGVPDVFRHDYYLTYTVIHESSHFLGLNHPHDGAVTVGKKSDGTWGYYYSMLNWLFDMSASPTTYAGDYSQYEVVDQERLMYGHTAEYLKQAQDGIADAYFMDGANNLAAPSTATLNRDAAMQQWRGYASQLFQVGDYLHAQYAMKDAALYARGVTGNQVAPHLVSISEAASNTNVLFSVQGQQGYTPARVATRKG